MIVAQSIQDIEGVIQGACVTIGNFDGVHKGHQELIATTCAKAKSLGLSSVVVTFDPHPRRVLQPQGSPPFITLTEQKLELISKIGPDVTLVLPFSMEMAKLSPREFIAKYLSPMNIHELVIGYDYAMGKGRTGDHHALTELGKEMGFGVQRLEPVIINEAVVSSTRIRDMVSEGDVWNARPLLGRFYQIRGEVVHGMNRGGRLLGFPTANIKLEDELFPKLGVYAIWVEQDGVIHAGVANIGHNPTFGNEHISVEAHLLDFKGDLYGSTLKIHFVQRLRGEQKFNGLDELKERIGQDIILGREILQETDAQIKLQNIPSSEE
ncbi:MAG: bifunctional riboflavin kinase/FAD synthetase [Desulfovibrio sp.]